MEYTVQKLAQMSGVSARTLRYYDQIGLLKPGRVTTKGYRIYGQTQVDMLQQILFYRELGFCLHEINNMIHSPTFDRGQALLGHLEHLKREREQIECLIRTVERTISYVKGEHIMNDRAKFKGLKEKLLKVNEETYGAELRQVYGDIRMDESNKKISELSENQWDKQESIRVKMNELLVKAMELGDPAGAEAQELCKLHREWLLIFWADGTYSRAAHQALGETYACDERFRAYYDKIATGAAEFLRDALAVYCQA